MMEKMGFRLNCDPQDAFYRCVEDCNEAIVISSRDGEIVYVNPAWEKIYGYSKEEAVGQTPRILHSGHHPAEFYQDMWQRIMDPEIGHWKGELINRAKNGRPVPVLLTITPFRSIAGDVVGHMGIALDMTHKKELEAKVVHQDRLASIGLLASGLAHEVGTPLGVVRGRAEFLMLKSADQGFAKDLQVIISQIDRISKIISSLLSISRSVSDIRMESVNARSAINDVVALLGRNLNEDFAEVRVTIPDGLQLKADFGRLQQVLLNLVTNSIHAIRKAIQDGRSGPHALSILASRRKEKVAIEVSDTGCGIEAHNLTKIFQPFFTTKDIGEGTGLGLAIVAQLMREMGGEISVQSTFGQGTTFTILVGSG